MNIINKKELMNKRFLAGYFAFLLCGMANAQSKVAGSVVSAEDGQPVVGASIMVAGTETC